MFEEYHAKYRNLPANGSIYSDAANHCSRWSYYKVSGSTTSSVHEATHGINADLRNGAIRLLMMGIEAVDPSIPPGTVLYNLYVPDIEEGNIGDYQAAYNAFYCLSNRAIKLPEPGIRKRDCIKFIPQVFRQSRFNLYVQGQTAWDGQPLYLFDEWTAYCNGAECAVVDGTGAKNSDVIFGQVEFVAYCTAILMAAYDKQGQIDSALAAFSAWQIQRSFDLYLKGKDKYPWAAAEKIYNQLVSGVEGQAYREFWKAKLNYPPSDDEVNFYV